MDTSQWASGEGEGDDDDDDDDDDDTNDNDDDDDENCMYFHYPVAGWAPSLDFSFL